MKKTNQKQAAVAAMKQLEETVARLRHQEVRDGYALLTGEGRYGVGKTGHAFGSQGDTEGDRITHDDKGGVVGCAVSVTPSYNAHTGIERGGNLNSGGWTTYFTPEQMVRLAKALLAGSVGIWDVHVDDMEIATALRMAGVEGHGRLQPGDAHLLPESADTHLLPEGGRGRR